MNVHLVRWGQLGFAYQLAVLAGRGRCRPGAPRPSRAGRAAPRAATRGRRRPRFEAGAPAGPGSGLRSRHQGRTDGRMEGWMVRPPGTLPARRQPGRRPFGVPPQPGAMCPARLSRRSAGSRPRPGTCANSRSHDTLHHFQVAQEEKPKLKISTA